MEAPNVDHVALEALLAASEDLLRLGEHTDGAARAEQAVSLAEVIGLADRTAAGLALLAAHEFRLGDTERSLVTQHRALAVFTELEDLKGVSGALNGMVMAYNAMGLQEEALEHAARSLEVAKRSGDPLTLAWAYNRAGIGHASVGNVEEGVACLEFALELAREAEDEDAVFAALNNLVDDLNTLTRDLLSAGEPGRAAARAERALELGWEALEYARRSHSSYDEAIILLTLGQALGFAGQPERGLGLLTEAEELAVRGGYRTILMEVRYEKARLELDRGQNRAAVRRFAALLEQTDRARDAMLLVKIHLGLWRAHKALGQFREALESHERFHGLEADQRTEVATTRARILSTQLDLDRAHLRAERAAQEAETERLRTRELEAEALAMRAEQELLTRQADEDELTGLWNRRHIDHVLPKLVRGAARAGQPLSVAFLDADHFKSVNDRFGHLVGDEVLRGLSRIMREHVRPGDVVARLGGEEFLILLPGLEDEDTAELGRRLCAAIRNEPWEDVAPQASVTVSVGVATTRPASDAPSAVTREVAELMRRADLALYAAKAAGRNAVVAAGPA